jgi:hypothetical protein
MENISPLYPGTTLVQSPLASTHFLRVIFGAIKSNRAIFRPRCWANVVMCSDAEVAPPNSLQAHGHALSQDEILCIKNSEALLNLYRGSFQRQGSPFRVFHKHISVASHQRFSAKGLCDREQCGRLPWARWECLPQVFSRNTLCWRSLTLLRRSPCGCTSTTKFGWWRKLPFAREGKLHSSFVL